MYSRRHFIKGVTAGTASLALVGCGGGGGGSKAPTLGAQPVAPGQSQAPSLFIPPLIDTRNQTTDIWVKQQMATIVGGKQTPTYGYSTATHNLNLLGPTLLMEKGMTSSLNFINQLQEVTTAHQHGLHVSGDNDGGPQSSIAPGQSRTNVLEIDQPAGTHWYHPHPHGKTGSQVIKGLAGLIIIQDQAEKERLPNLPRDYGVNDIPLIIQDKSFNADGSISYNPPASYGKRGYLGENILVNGQLQPRLSVPSGWVRFRILNGSNARFYERDDALSFNNQQAFQVIATDGGLMSAPVSLSTLPVGPGERYEIMLNLSAGQQVQLMAGKRKLLDIVADNQKADNRSSALPASLATLPATPSLAGLTRREFKLGGNMTINDKRMNMAVIDERVPLGATEVWRIHGKGAKHTFHVHGCSFMILNRDGNAPYAWERGWKDTVIISGKRPAEVLVRFDKPASQAKPFMYHCHMLEHEDMGMMGQFTVG